MYNLHLPIIPEVKWRTWGYVGHTHTHTKYTLLSECSHMGSSVDPINTHMTLTFLHLMPGQLVVTGIQVWELKRG